VRRYSVQKCDRLGKNTGAPLEIYADSEIKAAEIATGMKLRQRGRSGEMRARVRVAGQASPPTPFFAARWQSLTSMGRTHLFQRGEQKATLRRRRMGDAEAFENFRSCDRAAPLQALANLAAFAPRSFRGLPRPHVRRAVLGDEFDPSDHTVRKCSTQVGLRNCPAARSPSCGAFFGERRGSQEKAPRLSPAGGRVNNSQNL